MNDLVTKDEQNTELVNPAPVNPLTLLDKAISSGATPETLEKMLALQERWEAGEAKKAYTAAMASFKENPPLILKDKQVVIPHKDGSGVTQYSHATLAQVSSKITESLAKFGLSHSWENEQKEGGLITVTCKITHVLGHSESVSLSSLPDNSGKKNGIQQVASAVTYLQRYTLLSATGLAAIDTHDDDGNGASAGAIEYVSDADMKDIREAAEEKGIDINTILRAYKLESLEQMPLSWYADCMEKISKTKKKENK